MLKPRLALPRDALRILIGAAVMLSLSMGMRQSLGIFVQPAVKDLSIAVADFTVAVAVQNLVWGFVQPRTGVWGFVVMALLIIPCAWIAGRVDKVAIPKAAHNATDDANARDAFFAAL